MLITNKGRSITHGQKVKVYFNLHKQCFSIQDYKSGLVIAHSPVVQLVNCTFKVSESGRQRVLREKKKNVHAYVIGHYWSDFEGEEYKNAYYNPYKYDSFVDALERPLKRAQYVTCINKKIKYEI